MFCPHCGKEVSEGYPFCPFCGGSMATDVSAPSPGRVKTAWEDLSTRWTVQGLISSMKDSLLVPTKFFRSMNVTGGMTDPLLYALITGMVSWMIYYFWQIVLHDPLSSYIPLKGASDFDVFQRTGIAAAAVLTPFVLIASLFIWSGMLHLLLMMVRGAKNGFEATFRVVSYSVGAYVFLMIPFCGAIISAFWITVIAIIGLKEAHGTTGGKASFAVLFPLIMCCAIVMLIFLLVLGTVAASFGTMPHQPWK
jgi:hypothetical protein